MKHEMRHRPFACSEVYRHPELPGAAFDAVRSRIKSDIPPEIASVCKNESNCTVFLKDGSWFTTWSQGSWEHAPDERIVFAISRDMGMTWTEPAPIIASSGMERIAYGVPFVVPESGRIYVFFFAGTRADRSLPEYDAGKLGFVFSDDQGRNWSQRREIELPDRDMNVFCDRIHGWLNHPPRIMPTGEVMLPFSSGQRSGLNRRAWRIAPSEVGLVWCENLLTEKDPERLRFTLLPEGAHGIRVDVFGHRENPSQRRLLQCFGGCPEDSGFNFQEMTVVALSDGRWVGVGRTFLGAPGYTVSRDRGRTWTPVEPLCYAPGREPIQHPMTMCPITKTSDGRFVLLFTNNDGLQRGAQHVWDGDGKTRNPQWIVVGREIPGERENAGLGFGEPMILAEVDDRGETNLKTGISMPQFFESGGRFFVCYNVNKEHILLDEIPGVILDQLTPGL